MARLVSLTGLLALFSGIRAQCGSGNPNAIVTGQGNTFTSTKSSRTVYTGPEYRNAIQSVLDASDPGERVSVLASGSIGGSTLNIHSGTIFEACGTIHAENKPGRGAIQSLNTTDVRIPYLSMTGAPYFGLRFSGTRNLALGRISMSLSGGLGVRFDRDAPPNFNVTMDDVRVSGAGSHAVETWNVDGLSVGRVLARDVGESGLLLQKTTNARVGLVDGSNVGTGTGYATFRMANNNGQNPNGDYRTNVYVDRVVSRGGGRGVFCVSQSGGVVIQSVDLAGNGNNAILIENCYNVAIRGGIVNGGGEVRVSARNEFPNTRDVWMSLVVNNNTVRESPCGQNIHWSISGNAKKTVC